MDKLYSKLRKAEPDLRFAARLARHRLLLRTRFNGRTVGHSLSPVAKIGQSLLALGKIDVRQLL
ncbi:MAG: hypothetical protein ACI92S_004973, partial [Planctomycetaceae bacterium]